MLFSAEGEKQNISRDTLCAAASLPGLPPPQVQRKHRGAGPAPAAPAAPRDECMCEIVSFKICQITRLLYPESQNKPPL